MSLALGQNEIHVWVVEVDTQDAEKASNVDILALTESARASRFRSEADRVRFVQRRAALRRILAGYLEVAPQDVAFTVNEFGKPSVAPEASAGVFFNASHSENVAMIAVGRSDRIGIDVERLRPLPEAESIASRFFAEGEAAELAALHPRDRVVGFFNAWTRKEAVVKALGGGLSIPLHSFEVSLRPQEPPEILRWDVPGAGLQRWRIHHIEPVAGYIAAVAADREASILHCSKWAS